MRLRRRSVLMRVILLVLVPLVFLVGIFGYSITSTARNALTLISANAMINDLRQPIARLQHALTSERATTIVYETLPTTSALSALQRQQAATDRAIANFTSAAESSVIRRSASAGSARAIAGLLQGLGRLPGLRAKITDRSITGQQVFTAYNGLIAASYQILEQSVIQEGQATQVLPAIAVIELAISNEYLRQESALLDGNFAANAFPARDHQAFVSLMGAHRLLYAQSYSYLSPADRATLNRDVSSRVARTLMMLEDELAASNATPISAPRVPQLTWDRTVATLSARTQQAVQQAEARLARQVRAQASARLHNLYLDGGLGLAAIIVSLVPRPAWHRSYAGGQHRRRQARRPTSIRPSGRAPCCRPSAEAGSKGSPSPTLARTMTPSRQRIVGANDDEHHRTATASDHEHRYLPRLAARGSGRTLAACPQGRHTLPGRFALGTSAALGGEDAEHLAALAAGLASLANGGAHHFGMGNVRQTLIEMDQGFLLVTAAGAGTCLAVLADAEADVGLLGYEMAMVVKQLGQHMSVGRRPAPGHGEAM